MTKVFAWFAVYFLTFGLFAGALFHAIFTLDVLILTSAVTCAVTFAFTFCFHEGIARHPRVMLSMFLLLSLATWVCSEIWLAHRLDTEINRRAARIRAILGERNFRHEKFSQELLNLAEQGDVGAQRCVGRCYLDGHGVEKDVTAAAKWYRLAAEQGDAHAQFRLGWFYDQGVGVVADAYEAERWLRMAGERVERDPVVHAYIGLCYMRGLGGNAATKDIAAAARWFGVAAESGDMYAKEFRAMIGRRERFNRRKWWMLALVPVFLCMLSLRRTKPIC